MVDYLIRNAGLSLSVDDNDTEIAGGDILIRDGVIAHVTDHTGAVANAPAVGLRGICLPRILIYAICRWGRRIGIVTHRQNNGLFG